MTAAPFRALSLIEPWATLMAIGAKRIETRSWPTDFRGPFAIHASKKLEWEVCRDEPYLSVLRKHFGRWDFLDMFKLGHIIGVTELLDCRPTEELAPHQSSTEIAFGDYHEGRFGFVCDYATLLPTPIPARGMLGLWWLKAPDRDALAKQVAFEVVR